MGFICAGCPIGGVGLPHRLLFHAMPRLCHVRCCSGRRVPSNSCSASGSSNGVSTSSARWGWGHCSRTCYGGGGSALCGRPQRWRAGGGPRGAHGGQGLEDEIQQFGAGGGPDVLPVVRLEGGGTTGWSHAAPPHRPAPPMAVCGVCGVGGLRAHRVWGWGGSVPVGVPPPPDVPGG